MGLLTLFVLPYCLAVFHYDDATNHTLDLRMGRKQLEGGLRTLESHQFRGALLNARSRGYSIRGFYHTSTWRSEWKSVMSEQLNLLDGKREHLNGIYDRENGISDHIEWGKKMWSSLLQSSNGLHMTVASSSSDDFEKVTNFVDSLNLVHRDKIKLVFNETLPRGGLSAITDEHERKKALRNLYLSEGEAATFMALHDYCTAENNQGRNALVYYFHLKGACCTRKTERLNARYVTSWREAMNAFNIEFPSICLRALLDGYDSCGMESQEGTYSGNFWWANCEHVARLAPLSNRFDAYKVEYSIFAYTSDARKNEELSYKCGYSTYNSYVDHYQVESPRSHYLGRLAQYTAESSLPVNFLGVKGEEVYNPKSRKYDNFKHQFLNECKAARKRKNNS